LELYLEKFALQIQNSQGLNVKSESTRVVCDYVLTSADNNHEIMGIKKRRFLSDLRMEEQLEEDAATLAELEVAKLPPTGQHPVVMSGDALDSLFDFFIAQVDGHALFNQYSIFKQGDPVVRNALEPLTISSDNSLPGAMRSYSFDELGFETRKLCIIENSVVKSFMIDGRYADLLNLPQTSALMNVRVECGHTPYDDFLSDGVIELIKFSTFQPNTISGSFSGEIRLGYLHKNGKKIPIKGGSVSGSTQAAFSVALKSREVVQRSAYHGPRGVFFQKLTIAGE
jgi:PmbA protein